MASITISIREAREMREAESKRNFGWLSLASGLWLRLVIHQDARTLRSFARYYLALMLRCFQ